ncbi:MAG: phage tail tape measure protein, partial [Candidatus Thorarchaeota archaeon]
FNLLRRGIFEAGREFVVFDQAITRAAAKFPEGIKRSTAAFEELNKTARLVGATTEFTAAEAAEGLDFLAMAGFNADQAIAALPLVVNLATAANVDLARSSDIASDALGAFNLTSKDAETQTANLARITDVFAKTTTSANTDMEQMFEAMVDGGPVMTAAGQSIETFAALVGTMADAGLKGSKAGTTLKNAVLQLQAPVPAAQKKLKELGIVVSDSKGNMRDIVQILEEYRVATKDMGNTQRDAATDLIFGKRSIAGVNILLAKGGDALNKYRDSLIKAKGSSAEMATDMRKGLGARLKTLKSAAIDLGFRFLEAFQKDGKDGIEALIEAIRGFDVKPIIAIMKDLLSIVKSVGKFVINNWPLVKGILIAIAAIKFAGLISGLGGLVSSFGGALASSSGLLANIKGIGVAGKGLGAVGGALGAVGAVVGAAGVGVAAGTVINEAVFAPANEAAEKARLGFDEALRLAKEAARYGTVEEQAKAMAELKLASAGLTEEIGTTEFAAGQITSIFTDLESPADTLRRRMGEAVEATRILRDAMIRTATASRVAPNQGIGGSSDVNVGGTIRVETEEGLKGTIFEEPGQSSPVDLAMAGNQ